MGGVFYFKVEFVKKRYKNISHKSYKVLTG